MDPHELMLDGNAAAGLLRELFATEMTVAYGTCAACGAVRPVGAVHVYTGGPGLVMRCPTCQQVLLRVVRGEGRAWLDLRGLRCLELPR